MGGAGALGGLYTALVEAPTEQVLVIGCDMPFLTAPFLQFLVVGLPITILSLLIATAYLLLFQL